MFVPTQTLDSCFHLPHSNKLRATKASEWRDIKVFFSLILPLFVPFPRLQLEVDQGRVVLLAFSWYEIYVHPTNHMLAHTYNNCKICHFLKRNDSNPPHFSLIFPAVFLKCFSEGRELASSATVASCDSSIPSLVNPSILLRFAEASSSDMSSR